MARRTAIWLVVVLAAVWLAGAPAFAQAARSAGGDSAHERRWLDATLERALAVQPSPGQPPARRDSVLNGVLIGAGAGALLGLIPDYYDDCEECHDSLYWSIAVGAGVGLVVDLLRGGGGGGAGAQSPPSKTVHVGVSVAPALVGVNGNIRWR